MKIFICRFVVLFLLLLQGFTPLVHAHVQMMDSVEDGLHIHHTDTLVNQADQFSSIEASRHSGPIIDMHAAIQQKRLLEGELVAISFSDYKHDFVLPLRAKKRIGFSPPSFIVIKSCISLSVIAPRAPPIS